ncbi:lipid-A-disaccharide synthase [Planctomycetaceae bacterium SH139]
MTNQTPHIFFSVGEPSGDQHTARLIRALRASSPDWRMRGFGGPEMRAVGCRLDYELTQMAVMGLVEVVPKLRQFFRIADIASRVFAERARPDAVVLADFPGFNWHIAKRAKRQGIPVFYYLPPQLWAWGAWRISKVRKYVDHVLSVLPFEHQWYLDHGIQSTFVGHPFFDAIADKPLDQHLLRRLCQPDQAEQTPLGASISQLSAELVLPPARTAEHKLVAVLPGSRWHEVQRNWPTMLESIRQLSHQFPTVRFAVAAFRDAHCLWCRDQMETGDFDLPIDFYVGKTSEIIAASHSAMMVSGSVSLELMARGTPAAVIYQTGRVMYAAGRAMVRVPSITLPNLIAGQTIFPELATAGNSTRGVQFLVSSLARMLGDAEYYQQLTKQLSDMGIRYASPGATAKAAGVISQSLGILSSAARPTAESKNRVAA